MRILPRTRSILLFGLLGVALPAALADEGPGGEPGPPGAVGTMQKMVTKEASFVLYAPKGWTAVESGGSGFRTVVAAAPGGGGRVSLSIGAAPAFRDLVEVARFLLECRGAAEAGVSIRNAMLSKAGNRLVFDGTWSPPGLGKREFRSWLFRANQDLVHLSAEAGEGKLAKALPVLLTVLANIRVAKNAVKFSKPLPRVFPTSTHRLRDGSASFLLPNGWRVHELGKTQFIAVDPTGNTSFISASSDVTSPKLGVRVPGQPISPYLPPHKALALLAEFQGIARNVRFQHVRPQPELARQLAKVYTLGQITVEDFVYTCDGRAGRSKGYTMGVTFDSRLGTNWSLRHLTVAASETEFDSFLPTFGAMLESYQIDDGWVRSYVARGMARLRGLQQRTMTIVSRNATEIRETMQAAFDERQQSMDYIDYQRTNYIRGEQDWISRMEGGTVYHTESWGTRNTVSGEYRPGKPYDYYHYRGENPKYREDMQPVDSRRLWERHVR